MPGCLALLCPNFPSVTLGTVELKTGKERERGVLCAVLLSPMFVTGGVWEIMPDAFFSSSQAVAQGKNKTAAPGQTPVRAYV